MASHHSGKGGIPSDARVVMALPSYTSFGGLSISAENPVLQPTPLLFKKYGILSFFYPDPPLPTYPDVYPEFSFYKIKKLCQKSERDTAFRFWRLVWI